MIIVFFVVSATYAKYFVGIGSNALDSERNTGNFLNSI